VKKVDEKPKDNILDFNSQNSQRNYMAPTECSQLKHLNANQPK
jgi:hypothetical protein